MPLTRLLLHAYSYTSYTLHAIPAFPPLMRKAVALQVDRLKTQQLFPGVLFEWQLLFRADSLGAQFSEQKYLVARTKVQILTLVRTLV